MSGAETTMYVCDRKQPCNASPTCGRECLHTSHADHALYPTHVEFRREGGVLWEKVRTG